MGRNDKRKERHRLKRQERKIALRRMQSGSPYRRLRTAGGDVACYINGDWHEQGIGSLLVFRHMPDGSHVLGAFLIDFWCIGLKDAWGRLNLTNLEVDDALQRQRSSGMSIIRIEPAVARRLVAGAVRFSRQNGFRLPRRLSGGRQFWATWGTSRPPICPTSARRTASSVTSAASKTFETG